MGKTLISAIAASMVMAAMIGMVTYGVITLKESDGKEKSSGGGAMSTSNRSIQSLCQPTTYSETCTNSLQGAAGNTTDPKQLVKVGFQVAKQAVQDAVSKFATIQASKTDPRSAQALEICRKVMEYAMNDLEKTVNFTGEFTDANSLNHFIEDMKVWLGGAVTYQDVCFDAFQNATDTAPVTKLRQLFNTSRQLTSNSLTMIDELKEIVTILNLPTSTNRRLLGAPLAPAPQAPGVLPAWMTDAQRHILEKPIAGLKPDAVVALDGTGQFKSVTEALETVPVNNMKPFIVYIKAGVYNEQVSVESTMTNVVLIGDSATKTVITGNKNFVDGTQTYFTATLAVNANGFMARDIGVENTAGPLKQQALALRVSGDYSVLYRCQFSGYQDTLYALQGRQFYRDCTISGTIDFIFGDALSLFQNCKTVIRKPLNGQQCTVTAQGRSEQKGPGAIILQNCTITGDPEYLALKGASPTFLGRPWRPYSRTVIMQSYIDDCISPEGWAPWAGTMGLDKLFYVEYDNRGPGAGKTGRVTWQGMKELSSEKVMEFTADRFFMGSEWVSPTGVPYDGGFMIIERESFIDMKQHQDQLKGETIV